MNECRPGNPDCVSGVTCPDCNYNSTGHTVPIYVIQSQAIFFTSHDNVVDAPLAAPVARGLTLGQNSPNPFRPATSFDYTIPHPADVDIRVVDVTGRTVREITRHHSTPGTFTETWNGRDDGGRPVAAGMYFYTVRVDGQTASRKMIRLR